jgi:hypothetical protein
MMLVAAGVAALAVCAAHFGHRAKSGPVASVASSVSALERITECAEFIQATRQCEARTDGGAARAKRAAFEAQRLAFRDVAEHAEGVARDRLASACAAARRSAESACSN